MTPGFAMTIVALGSSLLTQPAVGHVSVSELDFDPEAWDGKTVVVQGEVVGDYGIRTNYIWIQVNDDTYVTRPLIETGDLQGGNLGIGVRLPSDTPVTKWGSPGGDEFRGPIVSVTGTFRYNSDEAAGDTFVEAQKVSLIEHSRPMDRIQLNPIHLIGGLAMLVVGGLVFFTARKRRLHPYADESD